MSKTLRFLATGDLQCGNFQQFNYTRPDGMGSRLYNTLQVFDFILEQAEKLDIINVLLNGDIFEDNTWIDVEVFDAVYQKLERLHRHGLDVVINIGNHDVSSVSRDRVLHSLRPFRKVAQVIERPTIIWEQLWVVPWTKDPKVLKEQIKQGVGLANGLVLHCGVQGARTGPKQILVRNPIQLADVRPKDFNLVILSDYHTKQNLTDNVFYMGSPMQHSFGETHKPCIWDISLSKGFFRKTHIHTHLPLFRWISVRTLMDAEEQFGRFPGDYFKVQLAANSKIHPTDIESIAHQNKCMVQVTHANAEWASIEGTPDSVDFQSAIKSYVRRQAKGRRRHRLKKLGNSLLKRSL